jgi:hypothetical protein
MDIEKVPRTDKLDPIAPKQLKKETEHKFEADDSSSSFTNQFQQQLEYLDDLPEDIANDIQLIKDLSPLAPIQVSNIVDKLFSYGFELIDKSNISFVKELPISESHEDNLRDVLMTLFKLIEQYNNTKALHCLIEFWKTLNENSNNFKQMELYFIYLAKQNEFPLKGMIRSSNIIFTKKEIKEKTWILQLRLWESLKPYSLLPKARRLIVAFNKDNPKLLEYL